MAFVFVVVVAVFVVVFDLVVLVVAFRRFNLSSLVYFC